MGAAPLLGNGSWAVGYSHNEPNVRLSISPDGPTGKWTSILIPSDSVAMLIAELIHALPVGVEIDYEAIINSPMHLLARNLRLGNLTRENLDDEIAKLSTRNRSITKDGNCNTGLVVEKNLVMGDNHINVELPNADLRHGVGNRASQPKEMTDEK